MDYIYRLKRVEEQVSDKMVIIPRIYTNKPRTTGDGYKGMLHQPDPMNRPDVYKGILAIRELQDCSVFANNLLLMTFNTIQSRGGNVYGDFTTQNRWAIVSLNIRDYDSGEVSDALSAQFGIATRPGAHCAPLMHKALGTVEQGAVRFSFSHYNTMEEINIAVSALRELAQEE